jgi:hypothetical protein
MRLWEKPIWCWAWVIYGDPAWPSYSTMMVVIDDVEDLKRWQK